MSDSQIQFISAEELRAEAELQRASEVARTAEGMMNDMEKVYGDLGGPQFMMRWAQDNPSEFFKLKARLAMANKEKKHVHRIQIGLPTTELDKLEKPYAEQ